ncbi:MAG: Ger(x)C family spore germination protein [Tumebacillaceae bacterium]
MKRKATLLLILLMMVLLLSGCWNRRELNDLGIVVGLGIDKQGDRYLLTAQLVNPTEIVSTKGGGSNLPVTTFQTTGRSVFEAVRRMTTISPRKLWGSHLRVCVLGEDFAREGVSKALDLLSREHELRSDFYLIVAKGTRAENVLKVLTPLEKIPSTSLFSKLRISERSWAPTVAVHLDDMISDLVAPGKQPVLTGIQIVGDLQKGQRKENVLSIEPLARLQYVSLAMFKGDKLIGWLNENDSKGYNYILGKIKSTAGYLPSPDGGRVAMMIVREKSKLRGRVVNGKPSIDIHITLEQNVEDVEGKIDLNKTASLLYLEKQSDKRVQEIVTHAIHTAQDFQADIFGFGQVIHRADPQAWRQLKDNWSDVFPQLTFHVQVESKIRRIGTVGNSIFNDLKE